MQQFLFILTTVAPVFLICFLGIFLRKIRLINDDFVHVSSRLVFTVALPALVFIKLSATDFARIFELRQIGYICAATVMMFILIWLFSKPFIKKGADLGAFVQGSFRSNYAILGFAIIVNLFGEEALAKAAVILAFVMPLHNLLSIIVLTATRAHGKPLDLKRTGIEMLKNPLIIAALVSIPFSIFQVRIPEVIVNTGSYLSSLALPLALIGIGGSLNIASILKASKMAFWASVIRLLIVPLILTIGSIQLGYRDVDLGVMFLLFATPTAVVSFVMAGAMGANAKLAGNIVLMTTLGASVTITLGVYLLKLLNYL